MVDDGGRLLQGFLDALGPSLQLSMDCYFQVVVTIAFLKHHTNLVYRSSRDTM
jgi:hypothetical protein